MTNALASSGRRQVQRSFALRLQIELVPILIVASYVSATIALFFISPFDWNLANPQTLGIYLALCVVALVIGYQLGAMGNPRPGTLARWRTIFVLGATAACAIVFPAAYVYTGRWPWQVLEAIADQRAAYSGLYNRLLETEGTRAPIAIARAITYPLVFAALPIGVLYWLRLTWGMRALLGGTVLATVVFSLLRGTDREMFDLIMIGGAATLIALGRMCVRRQVGPFALAVSWRGLLALLLAVVLSTAALGIFVERKLDRYGGDPHRLCLGEEQLICAERTHPLMSQVGEKGGFAVAMVAGYASQGYYGVSLGLEMPFRSTLGIGHSPLSARIYEALTGDTHLYQDAYTERMKALGWNNQTQWSSLMSWIANDVGYGGAIGVLSCLGFLFGRAWRDSVFGENDAAAIVFCFLTQAFVYLPANNQLFQTLDAYLGFFVWVVVWLTPLSWAGPGLPLSRMRLNYN